MSQRWHINESLQTPNRCYAQPGNCPYEKKDESAPHFTTQEEARVYIEKEAEKVHKKKLGSTRKENQLLHAHPIDFDTELANLHELYNNQKTVTDRAFNRMLYLYKDYSYNAKQGYFDKNKNPITLQDAINELEVKNDEGYLKFREENKKLNEFKQKIEQYNKIFAKRGGWNRAFIVTKGHVHSSMDCSTCNNGERATKFEWLTQYSNHSEEDIINAAGSRACTVCYPNAPVDKESRLLTREEQEEEDKKNARKMQKARKEEERKAKAPTLRGEPLNIKNIRETFNTERSARAWYVNNLITYGEGVVFDEDFKKRNPTLLNDYKQARYEILYNLALKHDKSIHDMQKDLEKSVKAKIKRDNYGVAQNDSYNIPHKLLHTSPRTWMTSEHAPKEE